MEKTVMEAIATALKSNEKFAGYHVDTDTENNIVWLDNDKKEVRVSVDVTWEA